MSNLQCLSIRAVSQKLTKDDPKSPHGISVRPEDCEGKDVRCLRQSVWRPDSFSGSFLDNAMGYHTFDKFKPTTTQDYSHDIATFLF